MSDKMSDKMSSVLNSSNSSKFSVKSQRVIAAQVVLIAKMRKMLVDAGIDPDSVERPGVSIVSIIDPVCGMEIEVQVQVQVRVQYARHARYNQYVQSRAVEAAKIVKVAKVAKVMEVIALHRALPRVTEGVQAPVVAIVAGFVGVEDVKVEDAKVVEVAKVAKVDEVAQMFCVDFVAPVVLVVAVQKFSLARSRFKYKFKIRLK